MKGLVNYGDNYPLVYLGLTCRTFYLALKTLFLGSISLSYGVYPRQHYPSIVEDD